MIKRYTAILLSILLLATIVLPGCSEQKVPDNSKQHADNPDATVAKDDNKNEENNKNEKENSKETDTGKNDTEGAKSPSEDVKAPSDEEQKNDKSSNEAAIQEASKPIDKSIINKYLPKINKEMRFFGLAEYGHNGMLKKISDGPKDAIYEFKGVYNDGSGIPDKFIIRYYVDYTRGTVTEMAVSNTRGNKAEVNSRLHNLVVLKAPFKQGKTWSHKVTVKGKKYTVKAVIEEYNKAKGIIKVKYTVSGVPDYYNNTYIETRTFEAGYGMTGFSNLMTGDIGISPKDAKDKKKLEEALMQHMFGYSQDKKW